MTHEWHVEDGQPRVVRQYLDTTENPLSQKFATRLQQLGDSVTEERELRRHLRRVWLQGRHHRELDAYGPAIAKQVTHKEIADRLEVSSAAVSYWLSGSKGIESVHLELLRRHYQAELKSVEGPSCHAMDLAGYRRAVSMLARPDEASPLVEHLAVEDFWRLWFVFRHPLWLQGRQQSSSRLLDLATGAVNRQLKAMSHLTGEFHDPPGDVSRAQLERLVDVWGKSFILAVTYLDVVCWTVPNDQRLH